MADYSSLKAAINAYIKKNGRQQITGDLLNAVLNAAVDALGAGYQFMGIATQETVPGTPDARVFYLAGAGEYENFGGTEVPSGSVGIFSYGEDWSYDVVQVGAGDIDAVLYTEQTLTSEQKQQARSNIGAGTYSKPGSGIPASDLAEGVIPAPEIFWAVYGTTTASEIDAAKTAGKVVLCSYDTFSYVLSKDSDAAYLFSCLSVSDRRLLYLQVSKSNNAWANGYVYAEVTANRVQDISANSTQTGKYPSAKAVADYAQPKIDSTHKLDYSLLDNTPSAVLYSQQSLTDAEKAQARTNIGATAPEIFWAIRGTTTAQEIQDAIDAGKVVMCAYSSHIYTLSNSDSTQFYFSSFVSSQVRYYLILTKANNVWGGDSMIHEITSHKTTSLSNASTNTQYPSAKAVYDAMFAYGVVSQTQTWAGSDAAGWDYTMSNLVMGAIPKANIDLYVAAGATFNAATGYFELNGLTDISYQEMLAIYNKPITNLYQHGRYLSSSLRTNLAIMGNASYNNGGSGFQLGNCFNNAKIEVVRINSNNNTQLGSGVAPASMGTTFRAAKYLKVILSPIRIDNPYMSNDFVGCYSLETVYIGTKGTKSLSFPDSSRLTLASVVYMVDNSAPTSAITITLHATAYARCVADTTEYTYNDQTYTGIIAYAAAKNITIASA